MNLTLSIKDEISVLEKYGLNPTELFVLRLIIIAQNDEEDDLIFRYISLKDVSFKDTIKSLQNKGIINKALNVQDLQTGEDIYKIPINKNVIKGLYKSFLELGQELFSAYPQWGVINGRSIPLRGVAKKFNSLEDAFRVYGKAIRWSVEKHQEIIDLLEWASNKNLINCSLAAFIVNHGWLDLQSMKEGKVDNVSLDSFTDI